MPATSPCTLREDPKTGRKGVHSQEAAKDNKYNHNFQNRFCGCAEKYDPHQEKGIMFQCMGLGSVESGGCGEDWWHPECLIGLPRDWHKNLEAEKKLEIFGGDAAADEVDETPLPPGFPTEDAFEHLICFKCIDSNPWLKQYAGTQGFLPAVYQDGGLKDSAQGPKKQSENTKTEEQPENSKKRKAEDDIEESTEEPTSKRVKEESPKEQSNPSNLASIAEEEPPTKTEPEETKPKVEPVSDSEIKPKHVFLPTSAPTESFSLFLKENFFDNFCRCAECFPKLAPYPQLREEEETYEPPLSEDGDGAPGSTGTGSILERGEAALSNVDRVKAIEGAMIYNHLRDKVKDFLRPFAETGTAVSAEDVKGYFERLRGDENGIKDAASRAEAQGGGGDSEGDSRREQNGEFYFGLMWSFDC